MFFIFISETIHIFQINDTWKIETDTWSVSTTIWVPLDPKIWTLMGRSVHHTPTFIYLGSITFVDGLQWLEQTQQSGDSQVLSGSDQITQHKPKTYTITRSKPSHLNTKPRRQREPSQNLSSIITPIKNLGQIHPLSLDFIKNHIWKWNPIKSGGSLEVEPAQNPSEAIKTGGTPFIRHVKISLKVFSPNSLFWPMQMDSWLLRYTLKSLCNNNCFLIQKFSIYDFNTWLSSVIFNTKLLVATYVLSWNFIGFIKFVNWVEILDFYFFIFTVEILNYKHKGTQENKRKGKTG